MLKLTLFITIFIHLSCGYSQLQIDWITHMEGTSNDIATDIDVDSVGNIYTTGRFRDSVDFDPGPGAYYLYNTWIFYYSPFIMKQAPNGDLLWAHAIGDGGKGIEVEVDDAGNTWVLCLFNNSDTIDIDPGPGITNVSVNPADENMIICKYNSLGEFQWVQQFSSYGHDLPHGSIEIDDYGNCYVGGTIFGDSVNFNHDEPTPYYLSGNNFKFISKIDSIGNLLWAKKFGGSSYSKGIKDMKMDNSDNLVIIGDFNQWNDYDPGPGNVDYYCLDCVFNIKIDSSGSFIWGLNFASSAGSTDQSASALVIDSLNNIYQVGQFNGAIDFDPGPGIIDTFAIGGIVTTDSYIVKYDSNGTYLWHGVIVDPFSGAGGSTVALDIDIDSEGYIYSTGRVDFINDYMSLSPFGDTSYALVNTGTEFINKIDPIGELVWVHPGLRAGSQFKIDPFNDIIITGNFHGIYDFGTTFYGTYEFNAIGNDEDIFVKKIGECDPTTYSNTYSNVFICAGDSLILQGGYQSSAGVFVDTLQYFQGCGNSIVISTLGINASYVSNQNITICQGDSVLLYGDFVSTAGVYYDSLQSIYGCDSVLSTNLMLDDLPNVSLAAFSDDTICITDAVIILPQGFPLGGVYSGDGVNGTLLNPNLTGLGTHIVVYSYDDGTCINSDTTTIVIEGCAGINDNFQEIGILIYPSPNSGKFTIEIPSDLNREVDVKLVDSNSKLILVRTMLKGDTKIEVDITNYNGGIYYLHLIIDDIIYIEKILKL